MKDLFLVLAALFSFSAAAQMEAICVNPERTEALSYRSDGNLEVTILNGTAIGTGRVLQVVESYAVESRSPDEDLFHYNLADGRSVVMAWSVDSMRPDQIHPDFRARVIRMELLAQNGDRIATYSDCRKP